MIITTGRINHISQPYLDITVKSGQGLGRLLAPTWEMVMGIKRETLSQADYTDRYLELLRTRYRRDKADFIRLLTPDSGEILICCFCEPHTFCHRYIAVEVLEKIGRAHGISVEYGGEKTT